MKNGNLLENRVSEICVKQIRVNQGVGVIIFFSSAQKGLVTLKCCDVIIFGTLFSCLIELVSQKILTWQNYFKNLL